MNAASIDEYEELVCGSMKFFEEWKLETDTAITNANIPSERHELSKCFMSMVTYNDLCICVSGFFLYARSILETVNGGCSSGLFVPVLHSNTSSLEAWFSLVRLAHKDTSCHYITAVSTFYAGAKVEALCNSRNKSYIVAPDDEGGETAINHTLGRKDCWRQKTVSDITAAITRDVDTNETQSWSPFCENLEKDYETNKNNIENGSELCWLILISEFVSVNCFWDILFPANMQTTNKHDSGMCNQIQ